MGVNPSYYRQVGDIYPPDAIILTQAGTFPLELEHYLGQTGADGINILNRQDNLKDVYAPFVRYQNKVEFVDYTRPRVNAFHQTFVVPASLGKKTLKSGKKENQLASFVSMIGGMIIFASLYLIVKDCQTISNSIRLIQKSKNIQKFLVEAKNENPEVVYDPVYKSLNKVVNLRKKIYKRNLVSAIIGVAMSVAVVAASVIAIVAAILATYPLLIAASAVAGALIFGHCVKTIAEWKGRLDKRISKEMLEQTEALRFSKTLTGYA